MSDNAGVSKKDILREFLDDFIWNDWQLGEEIGSGGSGLVYRIFRQGDYLVKENALKIVCVVDGTESSPDEAREKVGAALGELASLKALTKVPEVLGYQDAIPKWKLVKVPVKNERTGKVTYAKRMVAALCIRMDLMDGTLRTFFTEERNRGMTRTFGYDLYHVGLTVGKALEACERAANGRGIQHRDIKPDNIFYRVVDGKCQYKLGDFGIAQTGFEQQVIAGTREYMAPEVFDSGFTPLTDIYGLGMTLYEMANGYEPAAHSVNEAYQLRQEGMKQFPRPRYVPEAVGDVIVKATALNPEDRYWDARAFLEDWNKAARKLNMADAYDADFTAASEQWQNTDDDDPYRTVIAGMEQPEEPEYDPDAYATMVAFGGVSAAPQPQPKPAKKNDKRQGEKEDRASVADDENVAKKAADKAAHKAAASEAPGKVRKSRPQTNGTSAALPYGDSDSMEKLFAEWGTTGSVKKNGDPLSSEYVKRLCGLMHDLYSISSEIDNTMFGGMGADVFEYPSLDTVQDLKDLLSTKAFVALSKKILRLRRVKRGLGYYIQFLTMYESNAQNQVGSVTMPVSSPAPVPRKEVSSKSSKSTASPQSVKKTARENWAPFFNKIGGKVNEYLNRFYFDQWANQEPEVDRFCELYPQWMASLKKSDFNAMLDAFSEIRELAWMFQSDFPAEALHSMDGVQHMLNAIVHGSREEYELALENMPR